MPESDRDDWELDLKPVHLGGEGTGSSSSIGKPGHNQPTGYRDIAPVLEQIAASLREIEARIARLEQATILPQVVVQENFEQVRRRIRESRKGPTRSSEQDTPPAE